MAKAPKRNPGRPKVPKRFQAPPERDESKDFDTTFAKLPEKSKRLREVFAREYIKDFNATATMRRMGYKHSAIHVHGHKLLTHPYTQWFLGQLMDKLDEKCIINRNMVLLGLLKQANLDGVDASHAARVSAWRALGKTLGMEVTKVEGNVTMNGGVMAVPIAGSVEDWEKMSQAAQAKLKEAVRT